MSYILDDLKKLGVEEIIFITGYLKESIEAYIKKEYPEFKATFLEQEVQNGTAGAVALAEKYANDEVLIMFVDTLFDADLSIVKDLPADIGGVIWAKEVEDYQRFGVIVKDENNFMKRIVEKPQDPISKLANIGLYYMKDWKLFFEGVNHTLTGPRGPGKEFYITDAFQYMIDHGSKIKVVPVEGWYDCGEMETLLETNRHLLETTRGLRPAGGRNVQVTDPVRVEEGVQLENVQIGPNVTIMTGSVIKNSKLHDCIIGERAHIEGSELHDSMIGSNVTIQNFTGSLSVVDHSQVKGG
jgi:glucose-1-phosphate thymidylyltransferase